MFNVLNEYLASFDTKKAEQSVHFTIICMTYFWRNIVRCRLEQINDQGDIVYVIWTLYSNFKSMFVSYVLVICTSRNLRRWVSSLSNNLWILNEWLL